MGHEAFVFDDVRIPPDRQIGMHSHSCWEVACVICGGGSRTIGDLTEPFGPGCVVLVPPGLPHVWRFDPGVTDAAGNIANICVFFDTGLLASIKDIFPEAVDAVERIEVLGHAVSYPEDMCVGISGLLLSMRGLTAERRLPKMMELLLALSRTSGSRYAGRNSSLGRMELRLEKIRVYCACNYARPVTLDELSRHVGMNKSSFCTFMRRHMGMTLSEYVNGVRLERARERLIRGECSVAETALACGFQNVTYFNRLFRARYGCTPKTVRPQENK